MASNVMRRQQGIKSCPPDPPTILDTSPYPTEKDAYKPNLTHAGNGVDDLNSFPWLDTIAVGAAGMGSISWDDVVDNFTWAGEPGSLIGPGTTLLSEVSSLEALENANSFDEGEAKGGPTDQSPANDTFSSTHLSTRRLEFDTLASGTMVSGSPASVPGQCPKTTAQRLLHDCPSSRGGTGAQENALVTFEKILQPPASMLMGGTRKWRYLQRYLVNLGAKNELVMSALLCVEELLKHEESSPCWSDASDGLKRRMTERYNSVRSQAGQCIAQKSDLDQPLREELLAVIFLLAWAQVIRDQDKECAASAFPSRLADVIITSGSEWSWYSRQLLSWFNSLDSKATHLGGESLLRPKALETVSRYPIQIISCDYEESKEWQDSLEGQEDFQAMSTGSASDASEHGDSATVVPSLTTCDIKEIVLRAILQPAAEWYLKSQTYCRRIRALDKHHRSRFTPDDELQVSLASMRLQEDLWDLWAQRPSAISLKSTELSKSVSPDVAVRLEEVFSVYLASFWILLVYLHRVSWWHLSHTPTVQGALEETWKHMLRSYGEKNHSGPDSRTVHPALMWPVFLFGAECLDDFKRDWAVKQLQELGQTKPVLKVENRDEDTLPPFRLSHGAIRNANRAALLLQTLISRQTALKSRVDDRDLAMELFGCYFSIV